MARQRRSADVAPPLESAEPVALLAALDADAEAIGLARAARPSAARYRAAGRRSGRAAGIPLDLVAIDGLLSWRSPADRAVVRGASAARRPAAPAPAAGRVLATRVFEAVAPDAVHAAVQRLDASFSPGRGLLQLVKRRLVAAPPGPHVGRSLVVVHGTFSNADHFLADLQATPHGRDLLGRAAAHYDRVLFFDHATLARGPLLNAVELDRALAGSTHAVDLICHSRGGLVARWWLETLGTGRRGPCRAVLVGAPIAGTSLAAGPRLRAGIDAMTTLGSVIAASGQVLGLAAPFLAAPVGLLRILLSIGGVANRLPIADAALACVPGLFAQSRIGNNSELGILRAARAPRALDYFTVASTFEPADEGWRFWRSFRRTTAAALAAEVVFDGPNDLVVDTASMDDFGAASGVRPTAALHFGAGDAIHHCGYFRDPRTTAFIADALRIP